MSLFIGSGVALITPFNEKLEVNYDMLKKLILWHINMGTDALIICGTTAESATLSLAEKKEIIKFSVEVANHRIPVIAGTGSNDTYASIELSRYAKSVGVDGLLIVAPYYNKPTQRGIIAHYEAIASAVELPIILYNVPSRTGVNIEVDTVAHLSKIKHIVAIKEASGNLEQISQIIKKVPLAFDVYSGNDDQTEAVLKMGGRGVISVTANILPKEVHEVATFKRKGSYLKDLHDMMFIESNPVPAKEALCYLGFNVGKTRLPLVELTKENQALLFNVLENFDLKENYYENSR
jgi:4-hydroxy-tetrahydrodipicolinate synthase